MKDRTRHSHPSRLWLWIGVIITVVLAICRRRAREGTSGSLGHYGEMKSFVLPNTGMRVTYATKCFPTGLAGATTFNTGDILGALGYTIPAFPVSDPGAATFEPDVHIAPTAADYAAGRDLVLLWIMEDSAR